MARQKLAEAATVNQGIEQIDEWPEWSAMVGLSQDTLERVSDE